MASFKMTGTLEVIKDAEKVSDKFTKREFVLNDMEEKYPQSIPFQLTQDKCDYLDKFQEGQEVEVSFNMRGRKWTSPQGEDKYFGTNEAWRMELVSGNDKPVQKEEPAKNEAATEGDDDLPF